MPLSKYKGYSLRNGIFWGCLLVCLLSILGSALVSYNVLKENAIEQSRTDQQKKSDALMAALDYAVSHEQASTEDLPRILGNKIFEISDISDTDVVIYDLKGSYLLSNKDAEQVAQKKLSDFLLKRILSEKVRVDFQSYDTQLNSEVISSYMILRNNVLEPIAIVYYPYYHSDDVYLNVLNKYVRNLIIVNLLIILIAIRISWRISKNLTKSLTKFAEHTSKFTLFERDIKPIRYYQKDELSILVKSYNRMVLTIQEQRERLTLLEKEQAWREMAKQVAHEVKNPLTPMKLTIQNFKRKFDPNDPNIEEKVGQMADAMVHQIDSIATVATAFSQFVQLPEKNNEDIDLKQEITNIVKAFDDENIFVHSNRNEISIKMDKIYLNRIMTNLITNAQQAVVEGRKSMINVDIEQHQKRVIISVEDNGVGIKEDMYDRIFEPSFTSKNSGMGLGLTMVRKMIEDYQGSITVKSELGKGTKFTITLPANV